MPENILPSWSFSHCVKNPYRHGRDKATEKLFCAVDPKRCRLNWLKYLFKLALILYAEFVNKVGANTPKWSSLGQIMLSL